MYYFLLKYLFIYDNLNMEINKLDNELKDIENISNNNSDNEELILVSKYYKLQEDIANMNKEMDIIKLDRDKINKDILELEGISKNDNIHISKLERELKDTEIRSSKLEVRIDNILNSLNEDYSMTYGEAKDKYILEGKEINEDTVRKLYGILSKDLLSIEDSSRMGEFYRTAPVYILNNGRLDDSMDHGIDSEDLSDYMKVFFDYVNILVLTIQYE